ncbi:MAG: type III-B CRISPR module RAMP protein Cmr4 [Rhodocyclaceae bacterium]|nr:type III-B CRISPR module RAMP protein Cmr4 [Rhodocyclaceae bacterium]
MFEARRLTFYTCMTPLHMGAGTAIGAIDNPIQREVHSGHPLIAGSGIKGALRHHCNRAWNKHADINRLFGPEKDASEHAGALAFTDAQLVAFPVRALKGAFVWATCPYALARLKRLADTAGIAAGWPIPKVSEGQTATASPVQGTLILEAFEFTPQGDCNEIAQWLATHSLPPGDAHDFFRAKLKDDLVVLSDGDFAHFVKNATVVEPHVRIDDETGTAAGGGLFYTENLPPESILAGLSLASIERGKGDREKLPAETVLTRLLEGNGDAQPGVQDAVVQMGGDATTGRGLVLIHPVQGA